MKIWQRKPAFNFICIILFVANLFLQQSVFAQKDFEFERLISSLPELQAIAKMASEEGVTLGIYGGTVRDLFLKRPFTVISDCDLIYDSREPGFPAFRDRMISYADRMSGKMPRPDFHFDLASLNIESERIKLYHEEGITATKVGVFQNGKIFDPTKRGITDLRERIFSYYPPDREKIELHNLGRFIRDLVRLYDFKKDDNTIQLLKKSMKQCLDFNSDDGKKALASAENCKKLLAQNGRFLFHQIINPLRNDTRFLHNENKEKLTKYFPFDMFFGDIFRIVTQAPDMNSMRNAFKLLEIPEFLDKLGFQEEAQLLMNEKFSREDLFREFEFPGHQKKFTEEKKMSFLEVWENTLRKYNYRVIFDMLASDLQENSSELNSLNRKKKDFLASKTYLMLNPGDDYEEMITGFLDADFNIKILPRKKITDSLNWFIQTYLPAGDVTLQQTEVINQNARGSTAVKPAYRNLKRGFSEHVYLIDRLATHSFRDLSSYLSYLTGPELKDLYLDKRTSLAFFLADFETSAEIARSLGYTKIFKVNACGFSRRMKTFIAWNEKCDRVLLVQYNFSSFEQYLNQQARFYFLTADEEKTSSKSVFVYHSDMHWFPDKKAFVDFINNIEKPISVLFIGFTGPLKNILKNAEKINIGELSLIKGLLPSKCCTDKSYVLGMSGFGASYGSLPAEILEIIAGKGVRKVVFTGTGGGILFKGNRFGWCIPEKAVFVGNSEGSFGQEIFFPNRAVDLPVKSEHRSSIHATVMTPLCETEKHVEKMKQKGIASVDCELFHIVDKLSKLNFENSSGEDIQFYSLINITDVPGEMDIKGKSEINIENNINQYREVESVLKLICESIHFDGSCTGK
ncbi:MAG: hypothetical protein HQM10_16395 [Candidatus Riflebacteria bacterium]|nr:hypothetical protein [Candidatus Riflebacteria bacterium]